MPTMGLARARRWSAAVAAAALLCCLASCRRASAQVAMKTFLSRYQVKGSKKYVAGCACAPACADLSADRCARQTGARRRTQPPSAHFNGAWGWRLTPYPQPCARAHTHA